MASAPDATACAAQAAQPAAQTALETRLIAEILADGPLRLDRYMARCLLDRQAGYYQNRLGIGAQGDFITAPEACPLFGESLGLWLLDRWQSLGAPSRFYLVEAGPGRGLLLHDALRLAGQDAKFSAAMQLRLIEASEGLRALQAQRFAAYPVQFLSALDELERDAPLLLIANEFLDALPVRQIKRDASRQWREVMVGLVENRLAFGLSPVVLPAETGLAGDARLDEEEGLARCIEWSPAAEIFVGQLASRLQAQGGAALLIDYGDFTPKRGGTLQAVRAHRRVSPLERPGESDVSARVDFARLIQIAQAQGVSISASRQAEALSALGIHHLAAQASAKRRQGLQRLLDPEGMGGFGFLGLEQW